MIPEMNRLANHNEYLLMKDGARAHIAKLTFETFKDKKQLSLLERHHWPPNIPKLNPGFDFGIRKLLEQNVHSDRRITNLDS